MGRVAAGAPQVPWNCRRKKPEHSFFSGTWRSFVGLELSAHDCLRFDGRTDRKKESKMRTGRIWIGIWTFVCSRWLISHGIQDSNHKEDKQ